ncbi:transcriptional regulator [Amycolatopsis acidicola]|uniref:Transcriptional regulator n=1 Tax=Amycolatopsis acidicola TaxID=2596893 RepID=A0A5N0USS9_9PSEU|nr:helix-turn-helix transcriptional regulator [Amycolatopsis acidicola]KAA9154691.1 transcriptional regulator [Amycolatopsis acidicola]
MDVIEALKQVVPGLAATFGRSCEVVLHDYRQGERSVVAVSGEVTGRHVGGALSEIGLAMLARGEDAEAELNYVTRTPEGRTVKSSTLPLRDDDGTLVGALCVNLDVTALQQAGDVLADLAGIASAPVPATTFTDDFDEVVEAVVRAEERNLAKPVATLTRRERLPLLKALDERGVFAVRGAAPKIAARLGISRASLYTDLAECRKREVRR